MPVINTSYKDMVRIIGHDVPMDTVLEQVPLMGGVIDEHEEGSDAIAIEFFPNRPDMYSAEGIARGLKAFLGFEPGLKKYELGKSDVKAIVTDEIKKIRPYFMGCVVKGVTIDDQALRSIMELQEKLHTTVGRKRTKLAIGVHDLDKVRPPFTFKAVDPDSMSFVPLAKAEAMTPREVLSKHEKGKAFAHLMDGFDKFPIIFDADGNVLSFPPIINGALTTVTENTRNIFIDSYVIIVIIPFMPGSGAHHSAARLFCLRTGSPHRRQWRNRPRRGCGFPWARRPGSSAGCSARRRCPCCRCC